MAYLFDSIEDRKPKMSVSTFTRRDTTNHVCTILNRLLAVKSTLQKGKEENPMKSQKKGFNRELLL